MSILDYDGPLTVVPFGLSSVHTHAVVRADASHPGVTSSIRVDSEAEGRALIAIIEFWREHHQRLDEITTAPARNSDPTTSHEAARKITADNSRGRVLGAFVRADRLGVYLTANGATDLAGLGHQRAPWKRVSELKRAGLIAVHDRVTDPDTQNQVERYELTEHGRGEAVRLGIGCDNMDSPNPGGSA